MKKSLGLYSTSLIQPTTFMKGSQNSQAIQNYTNWKNDAY